MSNEQMELNIVRKVVWSYARSTGLDFDELCSEAYLAYLEAAPSYDPSIGKKTTFIWRVVQNHINNLLKKNAKEIATDKEAMETLLEGREELGPEQIIIAEECWEELFNSLSPEAKMIFFLLNSSEVYINTDKPREARGIIARELKAWGWGESKIWATFRELKQTLKMTQTKRKMRRTKYRNK